MEKVRTQFDALIGRKILAIFTNAESDRLRFVTDAGNLDYFAEGDCCSRSWFAHFSGLESLIGFEVREIVEHESVGTDGAEKTPNTDVERKYGWTFTTNRGRSDLDMRNDSNGYYGGSVTLNQRGAWNRIDNFSAPVKLTEDF